MDGGIITLLCTLITAGGTIAVAVISNRGRSESREHSQAQIEEAKKLQELTKELKGQVDHLQQDLYENNLETARVDLFQALNHTPHEHKAIMELAWRYFVDLGGDSYMSGEFKKWAKAEKVDIEAIVARARHLG